MASGKNHDRAACALSGLLIALASATHPGLEISLTSLSEWITVGPTTIPSVYIFISAAGALCHLALSPDLDLPRCNARRRWQFLGFVWVPYSKSIPHRHWLSHGFIVGTMGRLLYLAPVTVPIFLMHPLSFLAWASGLAIADGIHLVMDELM